MTFAEKSSPTAPVAPLSDAPPRSLAAGNRARSLVLLAAILFLVMLWGFVAYWATSSRQETVLATEQVLLRMNHAVEEQTRRLFRLSDVLFGVADQWVLDHPEADPRRDKRFLRLVDGFRARTGGVVELYLADSQGKVYSMHAEDATFSSVVRDADFFRAAMSAEPGKLHVGSPLQLDKGGAGVWKIPLAYRMTRPQGETGVLLIAIDLNAVMALYEEERLRPNGAIVLLRRDGVLLVRAPHDERLVGKSLLGGQLYREFLPNRESGFAKLDRTATDAMEKYVGYSVMKDFPLVTVVSAATGDVFSGWRRQVQIIVLLATVVSIVSLLVMIRLRRMLGDLAEHSSKLEQLATTDHLTGLHNRHSFMQYLEREFARSQRYRAPLSLLVLDLDFFKQINDGYGHAAGDAALREFASIAATCLRGMDIFGRIGGEEFGIVLPSAALDQAEAVAERIRAAVVRISISTEYGTVRFTTSIGAAQSAEGDEDIDALLARADSALYAAKAAGRNRVVALAA